MTQFNRKVVIKLLGQLKIDFFHPNLSDCEDVWSSDLDLCHLLASLPCILLLHILPCGKTSSAAIIIS